MGLCPFTARISAARGRPAKWILGMTESTGLMRWRDAARVLGIDTRKVLDLIVVGDMPAGGELGKAGTSDFSGVWRCSR